MKHESTRWMPQFRRPDGSWADCTLAGMEWRDAIHYATTARLGAMRVVERVTTEKVIFERDEEWPGRMITCPHDSEPHTLADCLAREHERSEGDV